MTVTHKKHFVVLALFAAVAAITLFYKIERRTQPNPINLNAIPTQIGDWRMLAQNNTIKAAEAKFLDDVLFRTYQRKDGKIIMLAIAYGADQRRKFSIHLPEVCYEAAGFKVASQGYTNMNSPNLTLKQFIANDSDGRIEPAQYWIVLNGKVVTDDFDRKLRHAYYNFFGAEAGGVLVRVSSFATGLEFKNDYKIQKEFITTLYKALNFELKRTLFDDNT